MVVPGAVARQTGAAWPEPTDERLNDRNGFCDRTPDTRRGALPFRSFAERA